MALDLAGSAVLAVLAAVERQWGFLLRRRRAIRSP
jgi:hypothetical protein